MKNLGFLWIKEGNAISFGDKSTKLSTQISTPKGHLSTTKKQACIRKPTSEIYKTGTAKINKEYPHITKHKKGIVKVNRERIHISTGTTITTTYYIYN